MAPLLASIQDLAFGTEPRRRTRLRRCALAAMVYVVCLLIQWEQVYFALSDRDDALHFSGLCIAGNLFFFLAIRSGLSTRFADAALTMPQMVFAITMLGIAYHINAQYHVTVLLVVPLVLIFGAFILPARRCVQLGWFALAVITAMIAYGVHSRPQQFSAFGEMHTFAFLAVVLPTLAHLAGQLSQMRIDAKAQRNQLRDAMQQQTRIATHDPLTELPNRRYVDERIPDVIGAGQREGKPLCLAILDLDRFKRINDTFGHATGDEVLRLFARETSTLLRTGDLLARWGGEEFLLVLPNTDVFEAKAILERMRHRVAGAANWAAYPHPSVTFSAGLTALGADQTLPHALRCADFALYDAKSQGRDRVVVAENDDGHMKKPVVAPRRIRVDHPSTIF